VAGKVVMDSVSMNSQRFRQITNRAKAFIFQGATKFFGINYMHNNIVQYSMVLVNIDVNASLREFDQSYDVDAYGGGDDSITCIAK
jgi:hypothetical protein